MNRKEARLALKTALTYKAEEKGIVIVENLMVTTPKVKEFLGILKTLKLDNKKVLVVVKELDENLILASRNLQNVALIQAEEINVLDVVAADVILTTEDAIQKIEEVLV